MPSRCFAADATVSPRPSLRRDFVDRHAPFLHIARIAMKMLSPSLIVCGLLILSTSRTLAQEPVGSAKSDRAARAAVRRSLGFLARDTDHWRQTRGCAACHHGPMYVWAGGVAQSRGYDVSERHLSDTAAWMVSEESARIFPKVASGGGAAKPKVSLATVYLANALDALPESRRVRQQGWERIADHWTATQHDDGSLAGPAGRPPLFASSEVTTRLARIAIANADVGLTPPSKIQRIAADAQKFLAKVPADKSNQAINLRLVSAAMASDKLAAQKLIDEIFARQQPDGGWAQADDLTSDAFATGQTLYALGRAAVSAHDERVQRAVELLVQTQQPDGAWPMKSRRDPATGKRARNLNPITYAATAWATLGIASLVPERSGHQVRAADTVPQNPSDRSTPAIVEANCPTGDCPGDRATH
jgi:hypothetical protein